MKDLGKVDETMLIFGGPYSNYAATAAMRARAVDLGIPAERVICTGDIVAYCGEPGETLDLIRDWGIHVVMGNCEESLAQGEADCGCGFAQDSECSLLAVTWYEYSNRRVTLAQRRWMSKLPRSIDFSLSGSNFRVVHGSLDSINEFVFASSAPESRLMQIRHSEVDAVIGGHSGIPFGQRLGECHWLNGGVIGMPANDGGKHGWYMLLEPCESGCTASWHRLDYDYSSSRDSTIAAGMIAYGNALASGLWPNIDILPETEAQQSGQPLDLQPLFIEPALPLRRANALR
ncbi:metallophosphatase family protein [Gammaproteobacteria bacterium]|nr:metallophosphatase family protein [Gammaproteobacteria bacterium]